MIKMIYEHKAYDYENVGSQPYDIKSEFNVIEDASATDVVETLYHLMLVAGYAEQSIINALKEVAGLDVPSFEDRLNEMIKENERLIKLY